LKGKERSYLKSLANGIDAIFQIGKGGITPNFIEQVKLALEARELIKITVLDNCDLETREAAAEVADLVEGELVQVIGKKFVIYKESKENKNIHIPKR